MNCLATDAEAMRASMKDPRAFEPIFNRHYRRVFAFLAYRVGRQAAEDLAADVFVIAFRERSRFDKSSVSALPWLMGIANNLARRHSRTYARRQRAYERAAWDAGIFWLSGIEAKIDAQRQVAALMEELVSLRVRDRETLLLYALTDLTYVQVAEALRIPVGTVRSRIARTRKRLEASIGPQMLPEGLKEHFEEGS